MDDVNNQKEPSKLVIMGMENAGKTTIVDYIIEMPDIDPDYPPNMTPTKNVKRKLLPQKNIMVWDFGGQELFRNYYLEDPESYFYEISFFYYVVDVQDYYRFFNSTMYFMAVHQLIQKYSPDAKIILLFHKMDPNYDPKEKNLKNKFIEKIHPFLQTTNTQYQTYDTTIFDLNSIKKAFDI